MGARKVDSKDTQTQNTAYLQSVTTEARKVDSATFLNVNYYGQ